MKRLLLVVATSLCCFVSAARAQDMVQGVVVVGEGRCQRSDGVVLYTSMGYVYAQEYSGDFSKDDLVVGDLNSYGMQDVLVNGQAATLWIDDYMLSRERAAQKCFVDD